MPELSCVGPRAQPEAKQRSSLESDFTKYGSYRRLHALAVCIRGARDGKYTADGRTWQATKATRRAYSLTDAVDEVASRNKLEPLILQKVARRVVSDPAPVKRACSARLIRSGRCFSINVMNYLVFRAPALPDVGHTSESNDYCFLIWPRGRWPFGWRRPSKNRIGFKFAAIDAVNIVLTLAELLALRPDDWRSFRSACRIL